MKIKVLGSVAEAKISPPQGAVVVIDVLRATSVIATALANGVKAIYPVTQVEEALSLSQRWPRQDVLLAGERKALQIPGFDLGNSPLECTRDKVREKIMIMTTSNGTRALREAVNAEGVYIGCLLNASAVATKLADQEMVTLFCAGTDDRIDLSDSMAAGAIIHELRRVKSAPELDDLGVLCETTFDLATFRQRIRDSQHGKRLVQLGLEADLEYCCCLDALTRVPSFDGEAIT